MSSTNFNEIINCVHVCLIVVSGGKISPVNLGFGKASKMILEFGEAEPEVRVEDVVVMKIRCFGIGGFRGGGGHEDVGRMGG